MNNRKSLLRAAGLLYLLVVVSGMFALAYVPAQLINWNNPLSTFEQISINETLFRSGIASSVICYAAFVCLPIVLFQFFKPVNTFAAQAMCALALLSVPVSFVNLISRYTILSLIETYRVTGGSKEEYAVKVMQQLLHYDHGILVSLFFWGIWLVPLGYLFYKADFSPKVLGILLAAGGLGHLINFFGNTLLVNYGEIGVSKYIKLLPAIAEMSTCAWLLFAGFISKKSKYLSHE